MGTFVPSPDRGDVGLPRVEVVAVLARVVGAEALLHGGRERVEERALSPRVSRDPQPARLLPAQVPSRAPLDREGHGVPMGHLEAQGPPTVRRLQSDRLPRLPVPQRLRHLTPLVEEMVDLPGACCVGGVGVGLAGLGRGGAMLFYYGRGIG